MARFALACLLTLAHLGTAAQAAADAATVPTEAAVRPCLVFRDGRTLFLDRPAEFRDKAVVFWLASGRGPFTVPVRDVDTDATRAGCPVPAPEPPAAPPRPGRVVTEEEVKAAGSGGGNVTLASASPSEGPALRPAEPEAVPDVFPVDRPAWERRAREFREPLEDQRRAVRNLQEQVEQLENILLYERDTGRTYLGDTGLRYRQAVSELDVQKKRLEEREADWQAFVEEADARGVPSDWIQEPATP